MSVGRVPTPLCTRSHKKKAGLAILARCLSPDAFGPTEMESSSTCPPSSMSFVDALPRSLELSNKSGESKIGRDRGTVNLVMYLFIGGKVVTAVVAAS